MLVCQLVNLLLSYLFKMSVLLPRLLDLCLQVVLPFFEVVCCLLDSSLTLLLVELAQFFNFVKELFVDFLNLLSALYELLLLTIQLNKQILF